jgi:hypothetical protein
MIHWSTAVLLVGLALVGVAHAALPFPITITTCKGYSVSKKADGTLVVRCPGMTADQHMFSIAAGCCQHPALTKRELSLTIDCK